MLSRRSVPLFVVLIALAVFLIALVDWRSFSGGVSDPPEAAREVKNLKKAVAAALTGPEHEDFDQRIEGKGQEPMSAQQREAVEALRREVPDVQVEFDVIKGSPRSVMSNSRFLTQNEPMPRALSYEQAMAKVKAYVNTHRSLFLHGGELLDEAKVTRKDTTAATGLQTLIWEQQAAGLPVFDSSLKANVSKSGEIMTVASDLMRDPEAAAADYLAAHPVTGKDTGITIEKALSIAAGGIGAAVDTAEITPRASPNPKLAYQFFQVPGLNQAFAQKVWLPMNEKAVRLAWEVNVKGASTDLFRVVVDAASGEALLRHSLTSAAVVPQYRVYTGDSPTPMSPGYSKWVDATIQPPEVSRQLVQIQSLVPVASPYGWINDGGTTTTGNNVDAYTDRDNDGQPDAGSRPVGTGPESRTFDFPVNLTQSPTTYQSASLTQLFYTCNMVHDRLYQLGFTETSGNFQTNNFGRNGAPTTDQGDNDAVLAEGHDSINVPVAADGSNRNNANMNTPPDGISPTMQMYFFDGPTPNRDGCLDQEVIVHEYTHGLSNRLVGSGQTPLLNRQARGMGEGWSDFYALSLLSEPQDDPHAAYPFAAYVTYKKGDPSFVRNYFYGIRRYPKSTDLTKNPLTFKDIDPTQRDPHLSVAKNPTASDVADGAHPLGEVWSSMLWEIRARMVDRYGWAVGNETTMQLVTDGMKSTPNEPNLVQARDAILAVDFNTGGFYRDILWNAFAKRGLGSGATSPNSAFTAGLVESYTVPPEVDTTPPVVTFSPLVNQQSFFEFSSTGPQALGGTINQSARVIFLIEEYNTDVSTNRYWNGTTWITDRNSPAVWLATNQTSGTPWTWTPAPNVTLPLSADLRNGVYHVSLRVTDNGGNVTETKIVLNRTVNAEFTPPVAAITTPAHNATIAGFHTLSGTASDTVGGSGLTGAVTLTITQGGDYWNGSAWQSTTATVGANVLTNGTWNCTLLPAGPNFRTGVFNVTAQAFDWAGNSSAIQSGVNSITFTVDTSLDATAPTVQITSPSPSGSVRASTNEIIGTAADAGGAGLLRLIALTIQQGADYWDGSAWSPSSFTHLVTVAENGAWVFEQMPTGASVRPALHTVTAVVYDFGGNTSVTQAGVNQVTYTLDTTPPTGTVTHPTDQAHYTAFPAFSGTAQDASGIQTVLLYIRRARDSAYWTGSGWDENPRALTSSYNAGSQTFTHTFTLPSVGVNAIGGTYYYDAIAVDAGGLYTQFGATVIIDYTAIFTWTGAAFSGDNLWANPANWSSSTLGFVPGEGDIAIINSGTPSTFVGENVHVRELRLNGGTLTAGTIHVGTALQMAGGTYNGTLTLETASTSTWSGGRFYGTMNIASGAALNMPAGGSPKYLGASGASGTIHNSGTLTWASDYPIFGRGDAGATINNLATGVFDIARNGDPLDYEASTSQLTFNNAGRVVKSAGSNTSGLFNYWAFTNETGAVIHNNIASSRLQRNSSAATLWKAGSVFRGPGLIGLDGGTIVTQSGSWTIESTAVWELAGATLVCPQFGTLTLSPASGGSLLWTGGRIHGSLTLPAGVTLNMPAGGSPKYLGASGASGTIHNSGTLVWASDYPILGRGDAGATINNLATGVFDIARNGDPLDYEASTSQLAFNNAGRVVKSAGSNTSGLFNYWAFTNEPGAVIHNNIANARFQRGSSSATLWKAGSIFRGPGIMDLNGGIITAESGSWTVEQNAVWELAGATLFCPQSGTLTLSPASGGSLRWTGGRIHGSLTIPAGVTLNMPAGGSPKYLGASGASGTIHNSGTLVWASDYPILGRGDAGATINNLATGVFDIARNGDPLDYEASTSQLAFNNAGRVVKSAGSNTSGLFNYWAFTNEPGAVIHNNIANARFQRGSSSATLWKAGSIFRGPGIIDLNGGIITAESGAWTVEESAVWDLTGATLFCPQSGTLTLSPASGSSLQWNGGRIQGNLTLPSGSTLSMPASGSPKYLGASDATGTLFVAGTLRWLGTYPINGYGGALTGASIHIQSAGIFDIAADGTPLDYIASTTNLHLHNSGSIRKTAGTGASYLNPYWTLNNGGQLNASSGFLDLTGIAHLNPGSSFQTLSTGQCRISGGSVSVNANVSLAGTTPLLFSSGTLTGHANGLGVFVSGVFEWTGGIIAGTLGFGPSSQVNLTGFGTKYLDSNATLNNAGTMNWTAGLLLGYGNSTFLNMAGGIFNAPDGGYFDYSSGGNAFTNAGTMNIGASPGTLTFSSPWSFTQSSTGILNIELGGTSTTQFDRLLANGPVNLGGTVNVTAINSFVPASGNSFNVMTFASRTGTFGTVNSGSMLLTKTYDSTSFTLATAAEPTNYTEWKDLYFGPGSPDAGDTLDPDNDGISNLMEYAIGSSPSATSSTSTSVTTPDAGFFDFIYSRKASVVGELTFQVQWKDTLEGGTWSSAGISETILSTTNGIQQVKATVPAGAAGHRFVHLLVTKP